MKPPVLFATILVYHFIQVESYDIIKEVGEESEGRAVESKQSTLKLAHVLFRHGIRTPVNTYKNDPYKNETFYPFGWGHLTSDGKRDLYQMGKWLAKRYVDFIKPYYNPNVIYARSTASPRTLMSMSTVLAAMFPPNNTPMKWNPKLNWQPIPIFSEPLEKDTTLRMLADCKAYEEMRNNITILEKPEGLFQELTKISGDKVTKPADVNSIFITLWAEQLYGPNGLRIIIPIKCVLWLNKVMPIWW
ncbi:prostatic acid phosphatase-like [Cochliomyia hominivorax]